VTVLFTDLKGSTALYERIGDLKAFSLVHQHFDRLSAAVQANTGAIVKTIGDAVMAAFQHPIDAVRAAVAMQQRSRPSTTSTAGTRSCSRSASTVDRPSR